MAWRFRAQETALGFRLTKHHRLLASGDFKRVFDHAEFRASSRHMLMLARPNEELSARVGLVISKKHVGASVQRNRIKRLCREWFRLRREAMPSIDLLLIARSGLGELDNQKVLALLSQLIENLVKQGNKRPPRNQALEQS